jgi:hypothetical protein
LHLPAVAGGPVA